MDGLDVISCQSWVILIPMKLMAVIFHDILRSWHLSLVLYVWKYRTTLKARLHLQSVF